MTHDNNYENEFECRHGTYVGPSGVNGVDLYCPYCKSGQEPGENEGEKLIFLFVSVLGSIFVVLAACL